MCMRYSWLHPTRTSGPSKNATDGLDAKVPKGFKKRKRKGKSCFDPYHRLLGFDGSDVLHGYQVVPDLQPNFFLKGMVCWGTTSPPPFSDYVTREHGTKVQIILLPCWATTSAVTTIIGDLPSGPTNSQNPDPTSVLRPSTTTHINTVQIIPCDL